MVTCCTRNRSFLSAGLSVAGLAGLIWLAGTLPASAAVVRFDVMSRESLGDQSFGTVGGYERIRGTVHYAIAPELRQNLPIVDLQLAPTNAQGKVEFHADFDILTPRDPSRGNGAILYDVNNRGRRLALRFFNDGGEPPDVGHGFLMRQGFTVVWSGWDAEILPGDNRPRLTAPVAAGPNGESLTGRIRCEMVASDPTTRVIVTQWDNHGSYRPTAKGIEQATLTIRKHPADARVPVPRESWQIAEESDPDPTHLPRMELVIPGGFEPGVLYELIYEARDPLVHGVCFAAVRDLIAALKHGEGVGNPFASAAGSPLKRAHAFGVSQSGRFIREFLYSGFNEDEQQRKVFDGLIPHVSGSGLGSFNHRFAQPTRHCTQHDHHDYPADRFPFAYETQTDPLSGRTTGILERAEATQTAPFVMHTQSSAEYWTRSGSLTHTDPLGVRDAQPPENVRFYIFGGTQHGPSGFPPSAGAGQNLANPGDYRPFLRALLLALDRWSRDGVAPPASQCPTIAAGTLVGWEQATAGFPEIPGVKYPQVIRQPVLLDFGPRWQTEGIVDFVPPRKLDSYRVLVPKCGPDGNEIGCLSPPEVEVPVATYTGWNLRNPKAGAEGELVSLAGSYIPLPLNDAAKTASGDPRASVAARYGTQQNYLKLLRAAAEARVAQGLLLDEDVARIVLREASRVAPVFERLPDPQ